jgi:hypothetical protein
MAAHGFVAHLLGDDMAWHHENHRTPLGCMRVVTVS